MELEIEMEMKVLYLRSLELASGSARAAYRVHQDLKELGVNSQMLVQFKSGVDRLVEVAEDKIKTHSRPLFDSSLLKLSRQKPCQMLSLQCSSGSVVSRIAQVNLDTISLIWISNVFL